MHCTWMLIVQARARSLRIMDEKTPQNDAFFSVAGESQMQKRISQDWQLEDQAEDVSEEIVDCYVAEVPAVPGMAITEGRLARSYHLRRRQDQSE